MVSSGQPWANACTAPAGSCHRGLARLHLRCSTSPDPGEQARRDLSRSWPGQSSVSPRYGESERCLAVPRRIALPAGKPEAEFTQRDRVRRAARRSGLCRVLIEVGRGRGGGQLCDKGRRECFALRPEWVIRRASPTQRSASSSSCAPRIGVEPGGRGLRQGEQLVDDLGQEPFVIIPAVSSSTSCQTGSSAWAPNTSAPVRRGKGPARR